MRVLEGSECLFGVFRLQDPISVDPHRRASSHPRGQRPLAQDPIQNSIKREGVPFRREKIIHQVPRRPRGPRPLGPGPLQNLSFGSFSPPGTPRRPNSSSVGSTFAEKGARKRASDRKRKWLPHIGQHSIVQWRDWRFAQLDPPAPSFTKVARAC